MPTSRKQLIYVVDDELAIRRLLQHWLQTKLGYDLRQFDDAESCLEALDNERPDLIMLDIMLPGMTGIDALKLIKQTHEDLPVIMLSAQGHIDVAVDALKHGALDYFPKTVDLTKLANAVGNALEMYSLKREVSELREAARSNRISSVITADESMDPVLMLVAKARESDISVLIQGESGTGKEVIARAIHEEGKRREGPFVAINCAAIPKDLLESEMFGHEKGAFTGAIAQKIGKIEAANGGTLFLDEIGEMEVNLQAKLLRVIQERKFERVGGTDTHSVDVRIISATNRDLMQRAKQGTFREDLYYRLAVFPIQLPPLRERRSDILLLAEHFLKRFTAREEKRITGFSKRAVKMLHGYPWPGNVRELESGIERGVILCESDTISPEDLPMAVQAYSKEPDTALIPVPSVLSDVSDIIPLESLKEQSVRHALGVTKGNVQEAAKRLGISRSTLYEMMKKYGVTADEPRE